MDEQDRGWQVDNATENPDEPPQPESLRKSHKAPWKAGEVQITELPIYNKSPEQFREWVGQVAEELETDNMKLAYHALRGVLLALRDRLTPDEVFDLSSQMPLLIRGFFFEGYEIRNKPDKMNREAFQKRVEKELPPIPDIPVDVVIRAVIRILRKRITKGEIKDIQAQLPEDVNQLLFG
jgi:uncharacterized protein (DUF2267 family)